MEKFEVSGNATKVFTTRVLEHMELYEFVCFVSDGKNQMTIKTFELCALENVNSSFLPEIKNIFAGNTF